MEVRKEVDAYMSCERVLANQGISYVLEEFGNTSEGGVGVWPVCKVVLVCTPTLVKRLYCRNIQGPSMRAHRERLIPGPW